MTHYLVIAGPYLGAKVVPVQNKFRTPHYRIVDGDMAGRWVRMPACYLRAIKPINQRPLARNGVFAS